MSIGHLQYSLTPTGNRWIRVMASTSHSTRTKSKAASETEDGDDSQRMPSPKQETEEEEEKCVLDSNQKAKKMGFHWSWADECTILKNLYAFAGRNGNYSKDFHHFVKKKLTVEVSNSQLSDKVYRLRKRFLRDESKKREGKMMKFSSSNYEKLFELSNDIWGSSHSIEKESGGKILALRSPNQWKAEAVEEFHGRLFKKLFEGIKVDISCLPAEVVEEIRKEWEDMKRAKNEYELMHAKLLVEISDVRCTQNKT